MVSHPVFTERKDEIKLKNRQPILSTKRIREKGIRDKANLTNLASADDGQNSVLLPTFDGGGIAGDAPKMVYGQDTYPKQDRAVQAQVHHYHDHLFLSWRILQIL